MSVNSLPIIFANPVPTPDPGSPPAAPATSPSDGQASFGAHLQHARNHTQPSQPSPRGHTDPRPGGPASANANANASSGKPSSGSSLNADVGANPSSVADQVSSDSGAASDQASQATDDRAGSLASAVLGLIGQSTADSGKASGATPDGDGKGGSDKPVEQAATVTDAPAPAPVQTPTPVVVAAIVPVPPPLSTPAPAPPAETRADTSSPVTQGAVAAAVRAGAAGHALPIEKFSASAAMYDDASGADDAGDDSASAADVSLLAQSAGNTAAAVALPTAGDAVAAAALDPSVATGAPPQDMAELAALRGVVGVPAPAAPTGPATGPTLAVNSPVGSAGFAQELGQQVAWLGGQDIKQAQIRLNPQELGPLEVKVSVEHGRVDVVFAAQHPEAVTAVQQSLGQLNQMLGGQGLSLGQAMVSQQQNAPQQFGAGSGQSGRGQAEATDDESLEALGPRAAQPIALGLLDAFA